MIPTSTDDGLRSDDRDERSFRRALVITVVALVVLVAAFAGLNYLQGPKLSSAQVDSTAAVAQAGQQLRLFANQNVLPVSKPQVSITPSTGFTVSSTGPVIAVQFASRLDYGMRYTVSVKGVTSPYQPQAQTFLYSFTTAKASVYYLQRANPSQSGQPDSIVRTGLRGSDRTIVYSAPHIQRFAVFPQVLAVATLNDDKTSSLTLVAIGSNIVEHLQLPGVGTVDQLGAAAEAGYLGFVFTSSGPAAQRQYSNTLMTVNLTGLHTVQPVLDLSSKPLGVLAWQFLNGSASIVAQTFDQTVLLIDPTKPGSPLPLGQFATLGRSSPDGKTLIVGDLFGKMAYSLASGKQTRLPPVPLSGQMTYGGDLLLTGSGMARVQQVALFDATAGGRFGSYLVYEDGSSVRILLQTKDDNGSIEGFSVSPNGQYVAVNVVPDFAHSVSDGYVVDPQATSITTVFIDIATGSVVRSVAGFGEVW